MQRRGIMSAEEAQPLIEQWAPQLRALVTDTFRHYLTKVLPDLGGVVPPALRAQIMHGLMCHEARKRFPDAVFEASGRLLMRLAPNVHIHFKQIGEDRLPKNFPTEGAKTFARQGWLQGIPPGVRLTLGYRVNHLGTELAEVCVLCLSSLKHALWHIDIKETGAEIRQLTLPVEPRKERRLLPKVGLKPVAKKRKGSE